MQTNAPNRRDGQLFGESVPCGAQRGREGTSSNSHWEEE